MTKPKPILKSKPQPVSGSQRPLSVVGFNYGDQAKRYDLEIRENIVRGDHHTIAICQAVEYCYEVFHTLNLAVNAAFGSTDGDDVGFTIAPDFNFGTKEKPDRQPIDADLKAIALDVIRRESWEGEFVIGGDKLHKGLKQALGKGDSFLNIGIEREGIGRNDWCVSRSIYLPTFECFRQEDDHGLLMGFEQRKMLDDHDPIEFMPWQIVHIRRNPLHLYGQSDWKPAIAGPTRVWDKLQEAVENLAKACRDVGVNPNVHEFEQNTSLDTRESYIDQVEEQKKQRRIVTDLYCLPGSKISKLSSQNPNLKTLIDTMLQWRYQMILPGSPIYLWPGMADGSARELSAQPALAHCRVRNEYCAMLNKAIRQVINTELQLKKGPEWFYETGRFYEIIWAKWNAAEMLNGVANDEASAAGIADLEAEEEKIQPNTTA